MGFQTAGEVILSFGNSNKTISKLTLDPAETKMFCRMCAFENKHFHLIITAVRNIKQDWSDLSLAGLKQNEAKKVNEIMQSLICCQS